MRKGLVSVLLFLFGSCAQAQDTIQTPASAVLFLENAPAPNRGRIVGVSASIGSVWMGSMIALQSVWYSDNNSASFQFFDDSKNWLGMDKAGHIYTAYQLNHLSSDLYRWSGVSQNKSAWLGFGIAMGYQTTLEILDGFSTTWGWSWADFSANVIGTSLYTAQEIVWKEQRIMPKFSYQPTEFAAVRPSVLGSTFSESLIKDYNGQTYWLSFSPRSFFPNWTIPKWACLSFGYSAHEKLVGSKPVYFDETSGVTYREQREFLFSLDIDFSQVPIKRPWLKAIVKQFNYLKIPFPTLMIRNNDLLFRPLYF